MNRGIFQPQSPDGAGRGDRQVRRRPRSRTSRHCSRRRSVVDCTNKGGVSPRNNAASEGWDDCVPLLGGGGRQRRESDSSIAAAFGGSREDGPVCVGRRPQHARRRAAAAARAIMLWRRRARRPPRPLSKTATPAAADQSSCGAGAAARFLGPRQPPAPPLRRGCTRRGLVRSERPRTCHRPLRRCGQVSQLHLTHPAR